MVKPIIGITPLFDTELQRLWIRPNYLHAVEASGGIPLVLPLTQDEGDIAALAQRCGGFLFSGGPDPHPALYGEETLCFCGAIDNRRDRFEVSLLNQAVQLDKPVFGICRGIQVMNVALGGSLYQDIPAQAAGEPVAHYQHPPYDVPVHNIDIAENNPLYNILQKAKIMVNSMHHQAVKTVAPPLRPAAKSKDGLVECVFLPGRRFFLGVQWHPEYLFDTDSDAKKLFRAFVMAAENKNAL
ncbi:gamma-glutamyl-gamma-aminobutyrate hydrolase family protein [Caproiciproducens galactitolivorans]|uniref:Gamma-glutamyl-gamma-aminobutyrate hydrolase PuuD n=1 Tax=Caproiciproducens galactitolivorans TaxID=642589 RepID=A0A4Z0XXU4_9FIRM|nr:gamma-glutamyl-gamma-aminobutyrate hydrolase family protein [Caproiciproducens galactitolivorans]QEY34944.1 gamma-glutamyl-gamma-aminobutyrate hydrolase family protein [Caproiciproducens galactitolivorans]TGJ76349.1 gamma-glutamyl-gamma-aminobutyrate hydrolase PuuD [Caproiciproducens galactitolivorans]